MVDYRIAACTKGNQGYLGEMLTPEEWAREQLKNAPSRSLERARRVALIYGVDLNSDEDAMTPDDRNAVSQDVPQPDDYAHHLQRVMSRLKCRISPENAEFLMHLLSESSDDPDRCGKCGFRFASSGHTVTCRKGEQ